MTTTDPIVYLNGSYLPKSKASFSVEDRGTMFGDGVYEVLRYFKGQALAGDKHLDRFRRSLEAIKIQAPKDVDQLEDISRQVLERNHWDDASIYWQITRGPAARDRTFPPAARPTVLVIATPQPPLDLAAEPLEVCTMLAEDIRWSRSAIKSLMLLPAVLHYNAARTAGYDDAILHRGRVITEATGANLFMVRDCQLHTHPDDAWILNGITRQIALQIAEQLGLPGHQQAFTIDELKSADELFLTGTTTMITAVTQVDGQSVGDGQVGPITKAIHGAVVDYIAQTCGIV
jgi:D-alanine transaminase